MNNQNYSPAGFTLLPPVVKNLLIINGLFFLATITLSSSGLDIEKIFGLYYIKSPHFQPYQFVTYMFVHANFKHIFFNLFALWMFGYLLENYWGSKRFLIFYIFCGLGAAATQTFVHWIEYSSIQSATEAYMNNPTPGAFTHFVNSHFSQDSGLLLNFGSAARPSKLLWTCASSVAINVSNSSIFLSFSSAICGGNRV